MERFIHEAVFDQINWNDEILTITVKKGIHASLLVNYEFCDKKRMSNIYLEEASSLTILMKNDLQEEVNLEQNIQLDKDAQLKIAYWELNEGASQIKTMVYLNESGANAYVENIAISNSNKDYFMQIEHLKPYTSAKMENYAIIKDQGKYKMEAVGKINKGAYASESHQSSRVLTLTKNHHSHVLPVLLIDENDVKASHATTLGQPDENQLYYLQTRGLNREAALSLLTLGYLMPISEIFDDESLRQNFKNEIEKKVGLHA